MESGRFRSYIMVFYGSESELCSLLRKYNERISKYVYILHDKDTYDNDLLDKDGNFVHRAGDIEKPHFHVVLEFYNGLTFTALCRLFTTGTDKPRVERVSDKIACFEYLIHKNDKDKYQYPYNELVSNDIKYFERLCKHGVSSTGDEKSLAIIRDMMNGVPKRLLMVRYGRDVIINYQKYNDYCDMLRQEDYDERNRKRAELLPIEDDDEEEQLQIPFD